MSVASAVRHDEDHQDPPNYCNSTINCRRKSGVNQEKTLRWTHRSIEQRERLGNWLEKGQNGYCRIKFPHHVGKQDNGLRAFASDVRNPN